MEDITNTIANTSLFTITYFVILCSVFYKNCQLIRQYEREIDNIQINEESDDESNNESDDGSNNESDDDYESESDSDSERDEKVNNGVCKVYNLRNRNIVCKF